MRIFDLAAVLTTIAAISGYLNYRFLRLPAASGTLVVALFSSLMLVGADHALPSLHIQVEIAHFLGQIDFNEMLMHGMLSFLLFAGALRLDLQRLLDSKWTIGVLSTIGVLISTLLVGEAMFWIFAWLGVAAPPLICFVFGALISPTDPVAVIGLLKDLKGPKTLEAQIAGESLFNDGVGVVVFLTLVSLAGLSVESAVAANPAGIATFFVRQVAGGAALGLACGYVAYGALKQIDEYPLELLITVSLVMSAYAVSFRLGVSGPIAVVVAGVLIGNPGRQFAMSERTRAHIDAFWQMIDELLNAVLFLLLGLQVFTIPIGRHAAAAALLSIPIVLVARLVSVALPVAAMSIRGPLKRGFIPLLTWSGLRGGISVAMVLSLPPFPHRGLLLACTYAVVLFSILVQGLTVRRVLVHYGVMPA